MLRLGDRHPTLILTQGASKLVAQLVGNGDVLVGAVAMHFVQLRDDFHVVRGEGLGGAPRALGILLAAPPISKRSMTTPGSAKARIWSTV